MQGCEGVEEVLALLKGELELAMKLSGEGGACMGVRLAA